MHLSSQDGWTALMKAYDRGHMECVKILLDRGAQVNIQHEVSGVMIHCVHAMHHVPDFPVLNNNVSATTLISTCV